VFESGPGNTEGALVQRRARFGRTAAGRLIELIEKSDIVGVAWGRTIKALTNGIAASRQPLNKNRHISFSPVCAELVSLAQHGYSSSRLADALDETFNKTPGQSPQLTGFPAYIPRHYDAEMRASIWRFISDTPGHHRVFSGPDALIHQMDMLISGVGSANTPVLGSFEELVLAGGLKADDLRQLVIGDLGGILIPKTGLSKAKQTLIDDLNELWTGIKTEHVHRIAERAFADHSLSGVVVVAIQTERGDTAFELIRQGLVNELILDHAAAAQLQRRLAGAQV
jgi:DNA-binding transcriptional regulator LsrR (DeoR family)